jgi:hypothetical protein
MKVQLGEMSVADAARELTISRQHLYTLEHAMFSAALSAVTPQKRGPKPAVVDPHRTELEERFKTLTRERDLLKIQLEESKTTIEEMKLRMAQSEKDRRGKKSGRKRSSRSTLRGSVPATGSVDGREAETDGKTSNRPLPDGINQQGNILSLEERRDGNEEETRT